MKIKVLILGLVFLVIICGFLGLKLISQNSFWPQIASLPKQGYNERILSGVMASAVYEKDSGLFFNLLIGKGGLKLNLPVYLGEKNNPWVFLGWVEYSDNSIKAEKWQSVKAEVINRFQGKEVRIHLFEFSSENEFEGYIKTTNCQEASTELDDLCSGERKKYALQDEAQKLLEVLGQRQWWQLLADKQSGRPVLATWRLSADK